MCWLSERKIHPNVKKKKPKNLYKTQPLSNMCACIKKNYFHTSHTVPNFLPAPKDPKQLPKHCFKISATAFPAAKCKEKKELWGSEWPWALWEPWAMPSQSYWLEESLPLGHGHRPLFCSVVWPLPGVKRGKCKSGVNVYSLLETLKNKNPS